MSEDLPRGSHLVPPSVNRRALAKMRGKLAASGQSGRKLEMAKPARARRPARIWPFVIALGLALAGMDLALHTQHDRIAAAMSGGAGGSPRLEPPPGLALDEQARFWCYAAYDFPRLKARFKLPKAVVNDKQEARANLERLLAENLGDEVRREVFAYQHAGPAPAAVPKPVRRK